MDPFTTLLATIALLILLALTSQRFGVDSREAVSAREQKTPVHRAPLS